MEIENEVDISADHMYWHRTASMDETILISMIGKPALMQVKDALPHTWNAYQVVMAYRAIKDYVLHHWSQTFDLEAYKQAAVEAVAKLEEVKG